jgi:hypothetical protein
MRKNLQPKQGLCFGIRNGSGSTCVAGYNVQSAVDTQHHLIVAHGVTNAVTDRRSVARPSDPFRGSSLMR